MLSWVEHEKSFITSDPGLVICESQIIDRSFIIAGLLLMFKHNKSIIIHNVAPLNVWQPGGYHKL